MSDEKEHKNDLLGAYMKGQIFGPTGAFNYTDSNAELLAALTGADDAKKAAEKAAGISPGGYSGYSASPAWLAFFMGSLFLWAYIQLGIEKSEKLEENRLRADVEEIEKIIKRKPEISRDTILAETRFEIISVYVMSNGKLVSLTKKIPVGERVVIHEFVGKDLVRFSTPDREVGYDRKDYYANTYFFTPMSKKASSKPFRKAERDSTRDNFREEFRLVSLPNGRAMIVSPPDARGNRSVFLPGPKMG